MAMTRGKYRRIGNVPQGFGPPAMIERDIRRIPAFGMRFAYGVAMTQRFTDALILGTVSLLYRLAIILLKKRPAHRSPA